MAERVMTHYVPSVFEYVPSPERLVILMLTVEEKMCASRLRNSDLLRVEEDRMEAATSLLELSQHTVTSTSVQTEPVSTNCVQTQTDVSAQLLSQHQENCQFLQTEKSRLEIAIRSM